MIEDIEALITIQKEVIGCRRLAAQTFDPEISRRLFELADEIEERARKLDREQCSPK